MRPERSSAWEDPAAPVRLLGPPGRALARSDAGEVGLALAGAGASVRLASGDAAPLALDELRWAAARALPLPSLRSLFGLEGGGRRLWFYHFLREALSPRSRAHWDLREALLREGLDGAGLLERHAARLGRIASRGGPASAAALLVGTAGPVLAAAGLRPPPVPRPLRRRPCPEAPGCWRLLGGPRWDPAASVLSPEGHAALARAAPVAFEGRDLSLVLAETPPGTLDAIWLGELSSLDPPDREALASLAARALAPGGRLAWRGPRLLGLGPALEPLPAPEEVPPLFAGPLRGARLSYSSTASGSSS